MEAANNLDSVIFDRYMNIPESQYTQVEYVWIGGGDVDVRCKTMTVDGEVDSADQLPEWTYDGSSTGQAPGNDSEIIIKPRRLFKDPFRLGKHKMVLCDAYRANGEPALNNNRHWAAPIFEKYLATKPWFGFEQEFTMFDTKGRPLGWPEVGFPGPQGPYYCSAGADRAYGRRVLEAAYRAMLYAGIRVSGINGEVMPGQWEYQVGPVEGIDAADQIWMSRYILHRVAEEFRVVVSFEPKPIPGDWNGAGAHTNFSTAAMRADGGDKAIYAAVEKLGPKHAEHMALYGKGNEMRMTGRHETASYDTFSYGVANRGASIRIPRMVDTQHKGYLEDRRPAANVDPYLVTAKLVETTQS